VPLDFRPNDVGLTGSCGAEDALELAEWLANNRAATVDLASCTHLHAAVLQTLLAYRPAISAALHDAFLSRWIGPLLAAAPVSS
jgi:hypothetical protein